MANEPVGARWPWEDPLCVALAERDGGWRCGYCGAALAASLDDLQRSGADGYACRPGFSFAQADHVVPRSRGGGDEIDNRVLACARCNQRKGTRPAADFRAVLAAEAA